MRTELDDSDLLIAPVRQWLRATAHLDRIRHGKFPYGNPNSQFHGVNTAGWRVRPKSNAESFQMHHRRTPEPVRPRGPPHVQTSGLI